VSWASPRHRFLTSSGLTADPRIGPASDQPSKPAHGELSSSADLVPRFGVSTCAWSFMESLILAQDERWRRA